MTDKNRNNRLTPKADFIANGPSNNFQEIVMKPDFRMAAIMAFSEYCMQQADDDPRSTYKISGAREFVNVLLNLGNPNVNPLPPKTEELIPV